jgi:hypothetical protein
VKALKFFSQPEPDLENSIKDAVIALEAAVSVLIGNELNFDRAISSKWGTKEGEIPPALVEMFIKIHAYRGNAVMVAHASLNGSSASLKEAEFVLSTVAAMITYLYSLYKVYDQTPF